MTVPSLRDAVRDAIDSEIGPALSVHIGSVEMVSIDDGVVRLRLLGSCARCYFRRGCAANLVVPTVEALAEDVTCVVENARY